METDAMVRQLLPRIRALQNENTPVLIAIDGRCASGKTTLANALARALSCNVFHTDDFFLRPEQRTEERYLQPGGNMDRERLQAELLKPVRKGTPFCYRPFDCRSMALSAPISVTPQDISIIEGAYSCHPELAPFYTLKVFLTVSPQVQAERIARRPGADPDAFREKWIPLEETYLSAFPIEQSADVCFSTD